MMTRLFIIPHQLVRTSCPWISFLDWCYCASSTGIFSPTARLLKSAPVAPCTLLQNCFQVVSAAFYPLTGALVVSEKNKDLRVFRVSSRDLPPSPLRTSALCTVTPTTTATKRTQVGGSRKMFRLGQSPCEETSSMRS